MDDRIRITIALDSADHDALSGIASARAQSVDELATEALLARIDSERDFDAAMRAGLEDMEAGRTISHEEYLANAAARRRRWLDARSL